MFRKWIVFLAIGVLCAIAFSGLIENRVISAQVVLTATPAVMTLPDETTVPVEQEQFAVTNTPSRTPTPQGQVLIEAISADGVNVRADASTESDILGVIRPGDLYVVRGRYFQWIQFEYSNSPTGLGWVYSELVTIVGDEAAIFDLSQQPTATTNPLILEATLTMQVITLTPGGVQTFQAQSAVLAPAPVSDLENSGGLPGSQTNGTAQVAMPTFTYPPNIPAQAPTNGIAPQADATEETLLPGISVTGGVAPIVPIVVLGGLGLLGLAVSSFRR